MVNMTTNSCIEKFEQEYKLPGLIYGQQEYKVPGSIHEEKEYQAPVFIHRPGNRIIKDLFVFMVNRIKYLYFSMANRIKK